MNQQLRQKLDHITSVLWAGGVTNPVTYIEQISYLIYLKLLDEEENSREIKRKLLGAKANGNARPLFPLQAERFRWSAWRFKSGIELRDFLRDEVFFYMASLVKEEPRVAEYFRDAVLEITDPNVLKNVIDEIDSIDFGKLGTDVKGDIFEYMLTHLGQSSLNGQFRTPRQIRTLMVEMVDPDVGDSIFDPACGTGGFLIDAVEFILAKYSSNPIVVPIYGEEWLEKRKQTIKEAIAEIPTLQTYSKGAGERIPDWSVLEHSIYGYDVSRQMMRITMMNLVLHGISKACVKRANTLSEMGGLTEEDLNRKYKVILSNPPFSGVLPSDSIRRNLPTNSKKSELLFLAIMMQSLAPGGICAVVVPEGLLSSATVAHIDLRQRLLENFNVHAIISLPSNVFKPYAGVKTSILIFRRAMQERPKSEIRDQRIWFYEILTDGYDPDKISQGGRPETPNRNDIPELLAMWKAYKSKGFKTPPGIEGGTLLSTENEKPRCWWVRYNHIKENEYCLSAGRYRPRVAEDISHEKPEDIIRETLDLEKSIINQLKELLNDIGDVE